MNIAESYFSKLKETLSSIDADTNVNDIVELKQSTHVLCASFLGGAWKTATLKDFVLNRVKGGLSNMLFLCRLTQRHPPEKNEPDKVLLRVYFNPETDGHLVAESVIFTLLSERHLGPKLYGIFNGGRLEEYIPSRPLACDELSIRSISLKIAKRLAAVHILEVPIWKEPDYLSDALRRWLGQLKITGDKEYEMDERIHVNSPRVLTCDMLSNELQFLMTCFCKSKSPVVFCHNDLQEGNILLPKASSGNIRLDSISDQESYKGINELTAFNPADPRLVLIDFEYASYNFRGFDFANHFVEFSIDYDVSEYPFYVIKPEKFPNESQMFEFFEAYLKETGACTKEIEELAWKMIKETLPFVPVSHFLWGVWGLLQVEVSPIGFGFAEYGKDRLDLYFKHKEQLLSLLKE